MAVKECNHVEGKKKLLIKTIAIVSGFIIALVVLVIIIISTILKSSKPSFVLHDATLYNFNLTTPTQLTSAFQVTVQAKNPSNKISIYYEKLETYASYQDMRITMRTSSSPTYQGTRSVNVWSPFLQGQSVPIAPYICEQLNQQKNMGNVPLLIKIDGRLRFRIGPYTSNSRRIHVSCQALIPYGNPNYGVYVGENVVKYQLIQGCSVIV